MMNIMVAQHRKSPGNTSRRPLPRLAEDADPATFFQTGNAVASGFAEALAAGLGAEAPEGIPADTTTHDTAVPLGERLKNYPPPQAELDCHGLTAPEAEKALHHFLHQAGHRALRTLRVITGKGLHSPAGPVLRDMVGKELQLLKKSGAIAAFRWEKKEKERSGSVIVYL